MSSPMSGHPGASSHRQPHRSHNDALPPLSTAPRAPLQPDSPLSTTVPSYPAQKKKYACHICDRGFTTSGHLARHARVHTGERNHKCPFPGCETRCSRQDNLQQHYRIHMSPGSRRTSGAVTRAHMTKQQQKIVAPDITPSSRRRTKSPPLPLISADQSASHNPHCITASPITPSANTSIPPPPDTPPPLVDAYRPSQPPESVSGRSSSRSSPELSYPAAYNAPHPASRVSHSPEAAYATSSRHLVPHYSQNIRPWDQQAVDPDHRSPTTDPTNYAYPDADQAPSPASSSGGHLTSQPHSAHPVSPQSPYGYPAHYGMQHGGGGQMPNGVPARATATSLAPLRGTPPPPLAQSSPYSHNYPSTSSTLIQHDASTGLSIAGYNTSQGRVQDSSSVTPTSAIAQQPYPNHYLSANAQSVPSPHHYTPHGTPSQSRQSSPPVVLAPIQSDRLPRGAPPRDMLSHGGSAHQQPLSAQQQSQHSALSVNRVSATQGHHHVGLATSYPSHMHQSQHPQHPHGGQTQYPYSTYSTLSANQDQHQAHNNNSHHDNWRTTADHYHTGRAALSHSHSMSSTGLAV